MKIGYNTNGFMYHKLDDALELIAEKGFRAVALFIDRPHIDPFEIKPKEVSRLASLLESFGLEPVVETGARFLLDPRRKHRPNLLENTEEERGRRKDYLKRCIDIAADIGAGTVVFFSGELPEAVEKPIGVSRLRQGVMELHEYSCKLGVSLALEPEPGHLVERIKDYREFASLLGTDLGLCLDIGHMVVLGEGSIKDELKGLDVSLLTQVHLEDARPGEHVHLEPGEGDVDFQAVFRELDEIGYLGTACWELSRSCHRACDAMEKAWRTWKKYETQIDSGSFLV